MTYAVLACVNMSADWQVRAICASSAAADSKMGRELVDFTANRQVESRTTAKVVLHTARHVGDYVDTREFTVLKSRTV